MDLILSVYSLMESLTVKQGLRWLEYRIHNVIPGLNHLSYCSQPQGWDYNSDHLASAELYQRTGQKMWLRQCINNPV